VLDALELDDVDEYDNDDEYSETDGQRNAGIQWHVHAFVSVNA